MIKNCQQFCSRGNDCTCRDHSRSNWKTQKSAFPAVCISVIIYLNMEMESLEKQLPCRTDSSSLLNSNGVGQPLQIGPISYIISTSQLFLGAQVQSCSRKMKCLPTSLPREQLRTTSRFRKHKQE